MNELFAPSNAVATIHNAPIILPEAVAIKSELLECAGNIEQVVDAFSQDFAVQTISRIKGVLNLVESGRKAIKAPFLQAGEKIDRAAADYKADLVAAQGRLTSMVSKFQADEQRKAREIEAKRQAELAEIARVQAELERAAQANTISQKDADEAREALATATAKSLVVTVEPPKAQGQSTRTVRKFRVVDLAKLYSVRPDLVELSPRTAAINKVIAIPDELPQIPGIEVYEEASVSIRSKPVQQI